MQTDKPLNTMQVGLRNVFCVTNSNSGKILFVIQNKQEQLAILGQWLFVGFLDQIQDKCYSMQLHEFPCAQVLQGSGKVSAEELAPKAAQRPGWIGFRCTNKPIACMPHKPAI